MVLKLENVINNIQPLSGEWRQKAKDQLNQLAMPPGSLGDLMTLAEQLAAIKQTLKPSVQKKAVVTMAGDHGVVAEGVSAFPAEVTPQMVGAFVAGGAAINVLAKVAGAQVSVVDMGVAFDLSDLAAAGKIIPAKIAFGTNNMTTGPAMTREQAVQALETGIAVADRLINDGVELLATGDMGIGNTTPSSAILAAFSGLSPEQVSGRGTGLTDHGLQKKIDAINKALAVNKPNAEDAVDVLAKVGGFEIGGIAGLILGAAYHQVPVLVDGFISSAGALVAKNLAPHSWEYMIASHQSQEQGHSLMLQELELKPLLNLNLRLGEGTGAVLAMPIVESAAKIIGEMLTFADAGVTNKE